MYTSEKETLKEALRSIYSRLAAYQKACTDYQTKCAEAVKLYSQSEAERRRLSLRDSMNESAVNARDSISNDIEKMRVAANAIEQRFNMDDEMRGYLEVINAAGSNLPMDILHGIVDNLAGYKRQLLLVKAVCEKNGLEHIYVDKHIIGSDSILDSVNLYTVFAQGGNFLSVTPLLNMLSAFNEAMGTNIDSGEYLNKESYYADAARNAFGLTGPGAQG
ncbi:MAG: hypothetical protein LKJ90_08940 [Faecalibacterium sp.]|jgi:hypothetical protein|nr:hypothetical protein [Faecalibacterium sp.]